MAKESGTKALADAGIVYDDIKQAYVGYCYGDSSSRAARGLRPGPDRHPHQRQRQLLDRLSSMARQAVKGGSPTVYRAGLREDREGLARREVHRPHNPIDKHAMAMFELRDPEASPPAPQMFGNAGREHMERYGSNADHFAWIGWKNHKHSVNNPYAQFQDEYSLEEEGGEVTTSR